MVRIVPRLEEPSEELLPGIPNDITVQLISPKLSWVDLQIQSESSHVWAQALQSRQVHNARVRAHSTETFVVIRHDLSPHDETAVPSTFPLPSHRDEFHVLSVYCKSRNELFDLPPIPQLPRGLPNSCQCVALDGKLYILGGAMQSTIHIGSKEVYMLDLADPQNAWQWKQCANMKDSRLSFGAAVFGGKIYVFGGTSNRMPVSACEVYNPKVNDWSPLQPMISLRFNHQVMVVGEKLFIHGGYFYEKWWPDSPDAIEVSAASSECTENVCYCMDDTDYIHYAEIPDVYDPVKDEWRFFQTNESNLRSNRGITFAAQGKLYSMNRAGIRIYDFGNNSSTPLHSFPNGVSYVEESQYKITNPYCFKITLNPNYLRVEFEPVAVVAMDDCLLLVAKWVSSLEDESSNLQALYEGTCILVGEGFGCQNNEMGWTEIVCRTSHGFFHSPIGNPSTLDHRPYTIYPFGYTSPILCPIQL